MSERNGGNPVGALEAPAVPNRCLSVRTRPLRARTARNAWAKVGAPIRPRRPARLPRLRSSDSFPFGIEEEFFLIDCDQESIVLTRPPEFLEQLKAALGAQVSTEMLQSQIEVVDTATC